MKAKMTLVVLTAVSVCTLGGDCPGPPPPPQDLCDPVDQGGPNMMVEYDYQEGHDLRKVYKLEGNVKGAFEFVDTKITICPNEYFSDTDLRFFNEDGLIMVQELEAFFYEHKGSALVYYLVSVRGLDINEGLPSNARIWGATKGHAPNVPPNPKWSFIFLGDIPDEPYGNKYTNHRYVAATTIHELGHQRAGLTHPHEHHLFHKDDCIMSWDGFVTDDVLRKMSFCWGTDPNMPDNCRYFLRQLNQ